jgi:hypothetical protein
MDNFEATWLAEHPEDKGRLMRHQQIDVVTHIVGLIGAPALQAMAKTVAPGWREWSDALEAKLLELHNRQTRAQDRATYERLMDEYTSQKSELRFREALEAVKA